MTEQNLPNSNRSRLVLVAPANLTRQDIHSALGAGDVVSVVLAQVGLDEAGYAAACRNLVPAVQEHDVAVFAVNDTVAAGRSGTDGVLFENPDDSFRESFARFSPNKMVGFGGALTRHRALELGEVEPAFMMFGKSQGDLREDAHPKNLALSRWWSHLVEIPCIVMAGSSVESVAECAASGAEFVACHQAVFSEKVDIAQAVVRANEILEEHGKFLEW